FFLRLKDIHQTERTHPYCGKLSNQQNINIVYLGFKKLKKCTMKSGLSTLATASPRAMMRSPREFPLAADPGPLPGAASVVSSPARRIRAATFRNYDFRAPFVRTARFNLVLPGIPKNCGDPISRNCRLNIEGDRRGESQGSGGYGQQAKHTRQL